MGKRAKASTLPKKEDLQRDGSIENFLDELQEEGEVDSIGSFSIDYERARQPLAEFSDGLLLILSAVLIGGATRVQVIQVRSSWSILFDAPPPKPESVKNLPNLMFDIGTDPWLRELGLAFNGLFPTHCEAIHWNAATGSGLGAGFCKGQWSLERVEDQPSQLIRLEPLRSYPWQLKFWVGHRQIYQALQGRLGLFPIDLEINGKPVDRPFEDVVGEWPFVHIRFTSNDPLFTIRRVTRFSQAFDFNSNLRCSMLCNVKAGNGQGRLILVYRGITMGDFCLAMPGLAVMAVVHTDRVDLDLSRRKVIENQRLENLTSLIKMWIWKGLVQWAQHLSPEQVASGRDRLLELSINLSSKRLKLSRILAELPLVQAADGQSCFSLEELRESVSRFGSLFCCGPIVEQGAVHFHERPLISAGFAETHRSWLKKNLGSSIESVDKWLTAIPGPPLQGDPLFEFEFCRNDWTAKLIAFAQPGPANVFQLNRCGQHFLTEDKITFLRRMLQRFVIVADFNSHEPFENTSRRLHREIALEVVNQIPTWLNQLCLAENPTSEYRERFRQLMTIRQSYKPQEPLEKRWLAFNGPRRLNSNEDPLRQDLKQA